MVNREKNECKCTKDIEQKKMWSIMGQILNGDICDLIISEFGIFNSDNVNKTVNTFLNRYFSIQNNIYKVDGLYTRVIKDVEKKLIQRVMKFTHFNKSYTARILGISRNTLNSKLKQLKVCCKTYVDNCFDKCSS